MNAINVTGEGWTAGAPSSTGAAQGPASLRNGSGKLEASPPRPAEPTEPDSAEVQRAAEGVNAFLSSSGSHVQFAVHQATKRVMVEVVDDKTQEVIRTIPAKELLDLAATIGEMVGLLLDKKG